MTPYYMLVEVSDFQKRLLVKSLESFIAALPIPPTGPMVPVDPVAGMHDLVRTEVTMLMNALNGPGELKPQNTFRNSPENRV